MRQTDGWHPYLQIRSPQLLLVIVVHHRNLKQMIIEMFGTLTFTKAAVNKFRVLTNAKIIGHEIVPPVTEMMAHKSAEVFAESIPCTILQVFNILESRELDWIVIMAMFAGAAFTSEAISYMTYVKDIGDEARKFGGTFYGFVPLGGFG